MVNYKNYKVSQRSHQLVISMYKVTYTFPKFEQFNFTAQINRAVLSIPTNMAEACRRETQKELIRFLYISSGSTHELGFIPVKDSKNLLKEIDEIKKMLCAH